MLNIHSACEDVLKMQKKHIFYVIVTTICVLYFIFFIFLVLHFWATVCETRWGLMKSDWTVSRVSVWRWKNINKQESFHFRLKKKINQLTDNKTAAWCSCLCLSVHVTLVGTKPCSYPPPAAHLPPCLPPSSSSSSFSFDTSAVQQAAGRKVWGERERKRRRKRWREGDDNEGSMLLTPQIAARSFLCRHFCVFFVCVCARTPPSNMDATFTSRRFLQTHTHLHGNVTNTPTHHKLTENWYLCLLCLS